MISFVCSAVHPSFLYGHPWKYSLQTEIALYYYSDFFVFSCAGIPPHIDTHSAFEDEIISLSLGAEVKLMFVCVLMMLY